MRMRIYRNYMLQQIISPLLISLLGFTFIFVIGNLIKLSDLVINKHIDFKLVIELFSCFIPFVIGYTLPIATLAATVLLFGRLSSDNEINALKSSGISIFTIVFPVLSFAFLLSLVTFIINDKIEPEAHFKARKLIAEMGIRKPTAYIEPGSFIDIFPGYIIFIYQMKGDFLKYVRIYQLREDLPPRILVAEKGQVMFDDAQRKLRLKLENVSSDEVDPQHPDKFYRFHSDTYFVTFDLPREEKKVLRKIKEYPIKLLLKERKKFKEKGLDVTPIDVEIHKRIAFSFAPLILSIFAIPLSIKTARNETSVGITIVAIIAVLYYLALLGVEAITIRSIVPPAVGMWLPDLIFLCLGLLLFRMQK